MSITIKTEKALWGRAANRCAICRTELVMDATETDDESLVGDACHIVAESNNGPRGNSDLTQEQRNKYANLILLCKVHHKMVDDQPNEYTIDKLQETKLNHEKWVKESLAEYDSAKQHEDEIYASYVDEWSNRVDLADWQGWTSFLMGPQPHIKSDRLATLNETRTWLLSRIWPHRYEGLEAAFSNFRFVLDDFVEVFRKHAEPIWEGQELMTKNFYNTEDWDRAKYQRLLRRYYFHTDLIHDLMLELTRAANHICDNVRQQILPTYRMKDGVLLISYGPNADLTFTTYRAEYLGAERKLTPYPGLKKFLKIRELRENSFGKGDDPDSSYYLEIAPDVKESYE